KSYASGGKGYSGNSYAQGSQSRTSSYASSGGAASNSTSYANASQRPSQSASYASSLGASSGGNSYVNRGTSYANPQHVNLGSSSKTSLLGIMHGAPSGNASQAARQNSLVRSSLIKTTKPSKQAQTTSVAPTSIAPASVPANSKSSIFSKLRHKY
ncbi:MAG: hypothetical protein K2X81_18660, partial [Candidatus Obscuribacterales bacterium]|nr:hypothetical protein [Candidatus Obscuribacterales bacterium]